MLRTVGELNDFGFHATVCACCGYRFENGDEGYRVKQTGDLIHRDCWIDYSDDYVEEMCEEIEF